MKNFLVLAILALVSTFNAPVVFAAVGVDISGLTSTSSLSCVKNYGYEHVVIRCYTEAYGNNPVSRLFYSFDIIIRLLRLKLLYRYMYIRIY